jgi:hypothetical protein
MIMEMKTKTMVALSLLFIAVVMLSGCVGPAGTGASDLLGGGGDENKPPAPQYYLKAVGVGKIMQSKYMTSSNTLISGRYAPYTKIDKVDIRGYEDIDVPLWIGPTLRQVYNLNKFIVADFDGKYVYGSNGSGTTGIKTKVWILEFGSSDQASNAYKTIDHSDIALLYHVDNKREIRFSDGAAKLISSSMQGAATGTEGDIRVRFADSNTLRDTDIPYFRKELAQTYDKLKKAYGTDTSTISTTEVPGAALRYNLINNLYMVSFTQQNLVIIVAGFSDSEQAEKPVVGAAGRINALISQQVAIYNAFSGG